MVGNDYTVRWQRLDGELWLRWQQGEIRLRECGEIEVAAPAGPTEAVDPPAPKAPTRKAPAKRTPRRKRGWMDGFSIRSGAPRRPRPPATPVALRAPSAAGDTS